MPDRSAPTAIVGFDGSAEAGEAIAASARLLNVGRVVIVTSWRPTAALDTLLGTSLLGHAVPVYRELDEIAADRARALAGDGAAQARETGLEAEAVVIEDAHPAHGLRELARERAAGALVVGGRPEAARHPHLYASVTAALLPRAGVPVLVVRGVEGEAAPAGPHLIAYDGCANSRRAIAEAGRLLRGAEAIVVHVWLPPSHALLWNPLLHGPGPLAEPAEMLDESSAEAAGRLAEEGAGLAREAGFRARALALPTERGTWRTLLRAAEQHDASTIVLGTHGRSVADVLLGSVAEGVARHAARPVLVVPAGADDVRFERGA